MTENGSERRSSQRRSIHSTVQYFDSQSAGRTRARISDLSVTGCYIDTLNPLPLGSKIHLTLKPSGESMEVLAEVVSSSPNMGMGVRFLELTPEQKARLGEWMEK